MRQRRVRLLQYCAKRLAGAVAISCADFMLNDVMALRKDS